MPTPPEIQYILHNGITLTVYSTKHPLWHGEYEGGKLAIYEAKQSGKETIPNAVALLSIYTSEYSQDLTVAAVYSKYSSIDSMITNMLHQVREALIVATVKNKAQEISDGQHRYLH